MGLGDIMKGNGRIKDAGAGKDFFQFMKQKKKGSKQSSFSAWLVEQICTKIINKKNNKWNCPIWNTRLAAQPANITLSHSHDWKSGQETHAAAATRYTTRLERGSVSVVLLVTSTANDWFHPLTHYRPFNRNLLN